MRRDVETLGEVRVTGAADLLARGGAVKSAVVMREMWVWRHENIMKMLRLTFWEIGGDNNIPVAVGHES